MLLYPEGMVKLNGSAAADHDALRRRAHRGGHRRRPRATYETSGLAADVQAFVELALEKRWLELRAVSAVPQPRRRAARPSGRRCGCCSS